MLWGFFINFYWRFSLFEELLNIKLAFKCSHAIWIDKLRIMMHKVMFCCQIECLRLIKRISHFFSRLAGTSIIAKLFSSTDIRVLRGKPFFWYIPSRIAIMKESRANPSIKAFKIHPIFFLLLYNIYTSFRCFVKPWRDSNFVKFLCFLDSLNFTPNSVPKLKILFCFFAFNSRFLKCFIVYLINKFWILIHHIKLPITLLSLFCPLCPIYIPIKIKIYN